MKWWQHAILCNTFAALYWITGYMLPTKTTTGALTMLCFLLFSLPDIDLKMNNKHRHWFFHSFILPLACFIATMYAGENPFPVGLFSLVYSLHLLGDLKWSRKGKRGTYLIYLRKGDRMSVRYTDAFLLGSGLISMGLAIFCLVC